ncbi:hypothetical protein K501DRAFT_248726 [Backusella circina FSU 941]|nr:hypothetical protein K501DRAFT_248726 [Backusella circina FSU 941]
MHPDILKNSRYNSNQDVHSLNDSSFETQFARHHKALAVNNMDEALQSFVLLQTHNAENEAFQSYVIEFSEHIDPARNTDMSIFFSSLPSLIQSTIIEKITNTLEKQDALRAYQALFDYIQNYSRHAYKYLIRAIKLLVLGAQNMPRLESKKYIRILVTELFPRLCKQRVLLTSKESHPTVKYTDGKQYISIPYNLFEQYLLIGQQYFIGRREWNELVQFTHAMLDCCGYTRLSQIGFQSHVNKFQYLQEMRSNLSVGISDDSTQTNSSSNDNELHVSIALMCEFKAVAIEFVRLSFDYYKLVCAIENNDKEEKSCLIPICVIKTLSSDTTTAIQPENYRSSSASSVEEEDTINQYNKRRRRSNTDDNNFKRPRLVPNMPERGEGLDSYCMGGVDDALQVLSKAADCMRHIVELWDWASQSAPEIDWNELYGGWEQEFIRVIDSYQLPFDITNAVLLVRSDMALSSPSVTGNLAKALKLSQSICDRIELHRRQYKKESEVTSSEFDIPFMFAFRVLYNIGVIYLLVGSIPQSMLEIAIILSVFPIPNELDDKDFVADEIDCRTVATIFSDHEFGLMRVTQEGLVVRCIKHLIVSLDNDSSQKGGMASIDSALRWDEKAGQIIVLMQYGWNYWSTRSNFWHKIVNRIKEKKAFKNRAFLEYIYVPEILHTLQQLHSYNQVVLDIIPPEFAMRSSYRFFPKGKVTAPQATSNLNFVSHIEIEENPQSIKLPSLSSITQQHHQSSSLLPPPTKYEPSDASSILPSMTMSPSWYSASTQKTKQANWMSPSFYYSRPATAVVLPEEPGSDGDNGDSSTLPSDIIVRCLEYRIRKYSPTMTPQRMRQVLQRFLKNMLVKEGS